MLLGVVEAVSDDEFVRYFEADVISRDVVLPACFFGEQNAGPNFVRLHGLQFFDHGLEGFSGIEDVVDE